MDYHLDPRMPRPDQCVQRYMIERWARTQPDKTFAIFADGEQWTYGDMQAYAIRTASALRALGVKQGERVLVWLPNNADCLRVWFGLNYLGAVFVPINTAYRGSLLEHAIGLSEARLMIAHADLCPRLKDVDRKAVRELIVLGGARAPTRPRPPSNAPSRPGTCSRSFSRPAPRGRPRA
jgi:crotonobetaine/carnitine-CoA ligase